MYKVYIAASTQSKNIGIGQYGTEQERMMQLADRTKYFLDAQKVFQVFRNKPNWTLQQTVNDCNNNGCILFVEDHTNAGVPTAGGTEVFYHKTGSSGGKKCADLLYSHIAPLSPGIDRGSKSDTTLYKEGLFTLRETKCPATLIEHIFHTNLTEVENLLTAMDQYAIASAIAICAYFGIPFKLPSSDISKILPEVPKLMYEAKRLFNTPIHIFTINQYVGAKIRLITTPGNQLWVPSKFYAQAAKPELLVNGSLFNMLTGQAYGENVDFPEPRPVFAVNKFGNVYCRLAKTMKELYAIQLEAGAFFLMAHGQLLNTKGQIELIRKADSIAAPRTMTGVKKDGRLVLVCAEGRKTTKKGLTIKQAAQVMQTLGCTLGAVNLDGGGSTQAYYKGKQVFIPSDNRARPIANMIAIYV